MPQPYTGKGVVVGIVDFGFDYTHAAFRDANGNLRIKRVWEQGGAANAESLNTKTRNTKSRYSQQSTVNSQQSTVAYGKELKTPEEILNAGADIRNNSHGTHVASVAAGSSLHADGSLRGMAPDADIVLVSMTDEGVNNVNITNAIAYIFNYAESVGKPCVVNLSLGSHSGPHDGTSTFDQIADEMQGPGRLIVGSAGNHRADRFHIRREFTKADINKPLSTFVSYIATPSTSKVGGEIEIWFAPKDETLNTKTLSTKSVNSQLSIVNSQHSSLVLYKLSTGEEVARADIDLASEEVQTLSFGRNVTGTFSAKSEVSPLNGKLHILLQSAVTAIRSGYAIALEITPLTSGTVDIWADNVKLQLSSNDMAGFVAPTADDPTICEIGGTASRILTVGAYTTRADYKLYGDPTVRSLPETDGQLCSFSSQGPTADGRIKPNVTAPGAFISAAVSSYDNSGTISMSQFYNVASVETTYGYMQGTSMSAPLVAGIVAAWLQAYPKLTPEQLLEIVKKSSRTDTFTSMLPTDGSPYWGYGKIDAVAGVRECQELTGIRDIEYDNQQSTSQYEDWESGQQSSVKIFTPSGILLNRSIQPSQLPKGTYIIVTQTSLGKFVRKVVR
ncbi:MAG: S8 family serine peptidase [Prevotella sp.]|nr:S8 family serine peptidase [Prevotella sp.]